MARTFKRRSGLEAISEINVTPLIDLAFALLIIFMITAPLLQQSIDIDLPKESVRKQSDAPVATQEVSIDAQGHYYWGDQAVSFQEIDDFLGLMAMDANPPVIRVRGDSNLPYQSVIDLVDLVKKHKLAKMSLETRGK